MSDCTIYYEDFSTYSGPPDKAPARKVQIIVQPDERVGWAMQSGSDYYVWKDGRWLGVDVFGLFDYLIDSGWKRVLFGSTITNEEYQAIYQRAKHERNERKSGWLPGERKP